MLFCLILTMKQFRHMNAYYKKDNDGYTTLYSYDKYMGLFKGDSAIIYIYNGGDGNKATTTNKQITIMLRELASEEMSKANEHARKLYRKISEIFNDLAESYWFSISLNAFSVDRIKNGKLIDTIRLKLF